MLSDNKVKVNKEEVKKIITSIKEKQISKCPSKDELILSFKDLGSFRAVGKKYKVSDKAGNEASKTRTVIVKENADSDSKKDTTIPVITFTSPESYQYHSPDYSCGPQLLESSLFAGFCGILHKTVKQVITFRYLAVATSKHQHSIDFKFR